MLTKEEHIKSSALIDSIFEHSEDVKINTICNKIKDSNLVLLGESTHGTLEFYKIRSRITKRLILEKGFNIIFFEGFVSIISILS